MGRNTHSEAARNIFLCCASTKEGSFSEVYNGPGDRVWRELEGKPWPSNGQYQTVCLPQYDDYMYSNVQGVGERHTLL